MTATTWAKRLAVLAGVAGVAHFGAQLRSQLDPQGVATDVMTVADRLLRPSRIGLWMVSPDHRGAGRSAHVASAPRPGAIDTELSGPGSA